MKTNDKELDTLLFSLLSQEKDPPTDVDRVLRRKIRTGDKSSYARLFSILIVVNFVMTLIMETFLILFIPILFLQVLATLHILVSLAALFALLILGKRLFVFLEGVYSK